MSAMNAILASPAAEATAWALVHFLWQGLLAGLATGSVLSLLSRARASTRYAVAVGALLLMAALPVVTALSLVERPSGALGVSAAAAPEGSFERTGFPLPASAGAVKVQTFGGSLLPWIFGAWLAGVAILALYHLGGFRWTRRLARQGEPVGEAVAALARDLCRRLGVGRAVALLESAAVSVPTVVGWLEPVVLVPASALTGLSPAQLEAILAHELAHVRRHDYLVNLLQTAVETLLFYHPAVWWVSLQIRRERENCCDDLAVAVCGDRLSYARALVDLEGLRSAPRLAMAASGGSLSQRVRRLVGAPRRAARRSWAAGFLALALLPAGAGIQLACSRDATKAAAADLPAEPGTRQGRWTAEADGDAVRLEMTLRQRGWGKWVSVDSYPSSELAGLTVGPDVRFALRRDAGVFRFRGRFDGRRGGGTLTFTADPAFAELVDLPRTSSRLLEMAVHDVSFAFAREMKALWESDPSGPEEQARENPQPFRFVHQVLGIEHHDSLADRLMQLRYHDITPDYVHAMQAAGYPHLQSWQLVELSIHGIEPGYAKGLSETGYRRLPPFRLVEFRTHGITAEWLRGIVAAGYADSTPDQLISMHLHGIDGDFIRKARAQGHGDLRPEQLIALYVQGKVRG